MFKPTTMVWQPTASVFFKLSLLTSALAALGLTAGCSSNPSTSKTQTSKSSGMLDANSLDSLEDLLSATDMRAVEGDRLLILKHGDVWKRMSVGFKMDENHWDPRIDAQRSWFVSRQPYIDRLSARASRYLYHTVKEAERRGLPTELALLPIIESSYDPAATSSAAAAGMWQFIPSTGKIYGLRQTSLYDGRRDVVESTRAAYEFLGGLYNQFGSWELALAAYNAGPGRIQQAINRNQAAGLPTDYWSLRLPQETMNYVPRFLAVAQIIKNPSKYGVSLPPIANRPHFREVAVPPGAQLNQIASVTGLSRAELYALNPGHRGEIVDPSSTLRILIPADLSPTIDSKLRALKPSSDSGYWASNSSPTTATQTLTPAGVTSTVTQSITPTRTAPPVMGSKATTTSASPVSTLKNTPQGSDALAKFAANADIPSAPRIPVAVTTAANVKPVAVEPPISAREKAQILAAVKAEGEKETVKQVLEPQATQAEKEEVVKEIKAIAPQGTEVLDPYDGKIKLTAIQTSQSVAEVQGKENTVGFAYPKGLAETTPANSEEAKLNQDKNFKKTDTEVVVEPPKGKRSTYTVLAGDTLATIALKNGVNWRDIAKWNQVDPNGTLFVGATLYLYDAKPQIDTPSTSRKVTESAPTTYVVKPNDSLTGVANQFDLSVSQLASYNNLNTNSNLFVGQKLKLKDTAEDKLSEINKTVVRADTSKPVAKVRTKSYVVKRGEYLKIIADRYALSVHELADLTPGLDISSSLFVGQKINVPLNEVNEPENKLESKVVEQSKFKNLKSEPSYKTENYKVQSGDSLSSIAAQSKLSLAELAELNKLSPSRNLLVGQVIKIPAGSSTPETYTVQSGDSLIAVANKYNLQVNQIAELNGLTTTSGLLVGQKLKLTGTPESSAKERAHGRNESKSELSSKDIHVVKSGETLASIAKKYKLQLSYLSDLNGLSRNQALEVGQRLKIEGDLPSKSSLSKEKEDLKASAKPSSKASSKNTESYAVKAGESLNVIASRVGLSVQELAELNDLSPRAGLQRGQSIRIPKTVTEYKVKSGDSLIRLASKFGIDTGALAEMNDLKPNASLRIGSIIKVPNL
ncbi:MULTISPECIES: LysM peptidoglycan-binding domain-containing protein [unclassified Acinetobacter]|uniref:LysM peptidoglycan-binding domain-containing protein n=1 Tax=unclassified Acinetobacter TaxID=196816 RepID=UPI0018A8F8E6|nr:MULTISPECIES: LysM peptidoglycan-binding domain-containing protein [unclassified Acinetobacter]MBJ9952974.1 LysM peptidoglycan-binding domain-containing protein [Acinetobacter baumannii]